MRIFDFERVSSIKRLHKHDICNLYCRETSAGGIDGLVNVFGTFEALRSLPDPVLVKSSNLHVSYLFIVDSSTRVSSFARHYCFLGCDGYIVSPDQSAIKRLVPSTLNFFFCAYTLCNVNYAKSWGSPIRHSRLHAPKIDYKLHHGMQMGPSMLMRSKFIASMLKLCESHWYSEESVMNLNSKNSFNILLFENKKKLFRK